ncbi:uncharacterized protein LOC128615751 [Ictalurus furcatus]|uniref:uncharacterized protein LOC128615751 n=1 Tax=Ictalurus furcatus TaxID=66913 RepID=UPI0023505458|nr:uncharacterized protein LOC128615751 [Ictalurus furcatus]
MDTLSRDSSGGPSNIPELRLILVGSIGCGKTLTADTLLNDSSSISTLIPSRLSEVRRGVSEGRHLRVVETPRWYWKGKHVDVSVQRETERALSLVAPGPHAFLILVPVGQVTEMDNQIPAELERVFGRGALEHSLVLLTCGDYLIGRDHERYMRQDEPRLGQMVNECGGRLHVINNRRPEDRQQVRSLLEKVEQLTESTGGCYLPTPMQREVEDQLYEKERELQRRYSLREEELVQSDHSTLTQTIWSNDETSEESRRRGKIRVRSMGPTTGRVVSERLANGLHSQSPYEAPPLGLNQKQSSFKLSKEGAILSQLSETEQPVRNQNSHNFINSIHYHISTMGDTSSASPSSPSRTDAITSYSPSSATFSSLSSTAFSTSSPSSNALSSYSSTAISSSPTKASFSSSSDAFSSSNVFPSSSPSTKASFSSSPSTKAYSSSSPSTNDSSFSSPSTKASYLSSSTAFSSSSPSTNASFSSSSTALSSRSTTASYSSFSSGSSDELKLVLLGRTGAGKSAAGNVILGRDEFKLRGDDATGATTQSCVKGTAVIGQKQVTVVDTPDWFWPGCPPEKLATHLSSCMDLCAPGPHAFLLCVPVTLPGRSHLHDLGSIRNSFGPHAILRHTLVLFTHSDMLKDGNVEEYIAAKRPELLELVEKCGDRYHVLKQGRNEGNIEELLEKVEQVVKENSGSHYSYQGQEEFGRERTTQLRRGRGVEDDVDRALSATLHSLREEEEVEQEEINAKPVESAASSVTSVLGSVLRFVGQKVGEGAKQVPKLVAGGAVLGGVLGLYVGGPVGGAVGATAGSVAAEYGRRKYNKPKTD